MANREQRAGIAAETVAITQAGLGSEAAVPVARAIHDELRRLG